MVQYDSDRNPVALLFQSLILKFAHAALIASQSVRSAQSDRANRCIMRDYVRHVPDDDGLTHITSFLVQCEAARNLELSKLIAGIPSAEVVASDPSGKFVVILETETLHQVTDLVDRIRAIHGVVTTTLIFHQIEETALPDQPVENTTAPEAGCQPQEVLQ